MEHTAQFGIFAGIIISLGFFIMIFGIIYLNKRERMAMIERGMDPRRYKPQSAPFQNLKWGLLMIGAGLGLFLAFVFDVTIFRHINSDFNDDNPSIYFALIAIFGGLGLFLSYIIEKKDIDKNRSEQVE
jgi:hypothetical protein